MSILKSRKFCMRMELVLIRSLNRYPICVCKAMGTYDRIPGADELSLSSTSVGFCDSVFSFLREP